MAKVRIAVAGAGLIGVRHLEEIAANSECAIACIVDPGPKAAEQAARFGVPLVATLAEGLATKPDGVILATPNALHVEQGLACIAAGLPTLVEKPLAHTLEAGERLVDAAEKAGVPILVGHMRRHSTIMDAAIRVVRSGKLGRLVAIMGSAVYCKPAADGYFDPPNDWRRRPGGGPILINMIHEVDALRSLLLRSSSGLTALSDSGAPAGGVAVADYYDSGSLAQRASIVQFMDVLLLAATGLLAVALVISLVGIANTLSLSVIERARESAVSRAIGMTRRQLRAGLALEALLLGGVGCLLGLLVGSALGWAGASALLSGLTDVGAPVVPAARIGSLVAVALVAALLASVLPGRRAARVSPTQALAEA